ncbi:hypothetical protein LCGC14_0892230 [marine sediment metagenome]|uniref:Uncharacterized protein n=1 Tax=marine sediment metagenome TaxID=412755 RepID=A0A0F9NYX9_9ZZZZ
MTQMKIEIRREDIVGAGHGNFDDPLTRALQRLTGKPWATEIYSRGDRIKHGGAWQRGGTGLHCQLDAGTTKALQDFDNTKAFEDRTAILTEEV